MSLSLHHQTMQRLGEGIVAGHHPAGTAMPPEPVLCTQMGVSRTVLREAVKSLVAKGLLSTGPKVGTRVLPEDHWNWLDPDVLTWRFRAGITLEFLGWITEMRQLVEPPCLRLAAQRATSEQLADIQSTFGYMRQAVADGVDDLSHDVRFHHLLLQASGNRMISQMGRLLRALLRASHGMLGHRPAVPDSSLPLHDAVVQAMLARDGDRAQQAMAALIEAVDKDLRLWLNHRGSASAGTASA